MSQPSPLIDDAGPGSDARTPRRPYVFLVVNAAVILAAAFVASQALGRPIADPEGSFLGPSWVRLPVLCALAIVLDLLPRALWQGRLNPSRSLAAARERISTHWTRDRLLLVVVGISCFYVIYVSYRNLKSLLPLIREVKYDRELRVLDRLLLFGHDPATLTQDLLGTSLTAHVLSTVYLTYIPLVAILVTAWLVWSRNIGYGWWFVTAQGIAWTLGTVSYYLLPTLGPGIMYPWLASGLDPNGTSALMDSLVYSRQGFLWGGGDYQGVAGFASLHTAIALLWALMAQATIANRLVRAVFWVNFALTVVATLYFGWHYIADDVAGAAIALIAFRVGGRVTGHRLSPASHRSDLGADVHAEDS
ncbi:phosphatase PAP2 family protein [Nocardioides hwasunensis]|uniref:Phosphatase PAP2 family protein n=1 Tax=Nocardioides hwasunensis TaxID=397258 RepID=A0ABR8MNE9_9ACTN|nr:phosphatase PAP2 family protein [Nocardioides hwasunensis]MBD3916816.1 phosphatase PAP2 family protein [Nocardioides hwasunensis]